VDLGLRCVLCFGIDLWVLAGSVALRVGGRSLVFGRAAPLVEIRVFVATCLEPLMTAQLLQHGNGIRVLGIKF
jgi:hypothetical protein